MAYLPKLFILTYLLVFAFSSLVESRLNPKVSLTTSTVESRPNPKVSLSTSMVESRPNPKEILATRLNLGGKASDCWRSLFQLQACSSEIITFFLNGKTNISPNCCQAIEIIQHECWPTLLSSLGYTAEEGNILEVYCATTGSSPPTPPSPPLPHFIEPEGFSP